MNLFNEHMDALQKQIHLLKKVRTAEYGFFQNSDTNILRRIQKHEKKQGVKTTSVKISQQLGITQATITPMLDRLLKKGYITKEISPTDKRAKLLSITPEGQAYLTETSNAEKKQIEKLITYLGEEDTRECIRLLQKMTRFLCENNPSPRGK
ncbi:MAG: MarR family winged helix-turn-helix transcriptional regulator [Eubacteriales bacterium]